MCYQVTATEPITSCMSNTIHIILVLNYANNDWKLVTLLWFCSTYFLLLWNQLVIFAYIYVPQTRVCLLYEQFFGDRLWSNWQSYANSTTVYSAVHNLKLLHIRIKSLWCVTGGSSYVATSSNFGEYYSQVGDCFKMNINKYE